MHNLHKLAYRHKMLITITPTQLKIQNRKKKSKNEALQNQTRKNQNISKHFTTNIPNFPKEQGTNISAQTFQTLQSNKEQTFQHKQHHTKGIRKDHQTIQTNSINISAKIKTQKIKQEKGTRHKCSSKLETQQNPQAEAWRCQKMQQYCNPYTCDAAPALAMQQRTLTICCYSSRQRWDGIRQLEGKGKGWRQRKMKKGEEGR